MKRTAEDAEKTRLALLEAALMSFEEKGWRGATFGDIAERAGVTRGALNHHFTAKTSLLTEALEWGWREHGADVFAAFDALDGEDVAARLRALVSSYVRRLIEDARFRALASTTVLVAPQAFGPGRHGANALDAWHEHIVDALGTYPLKGGLSASDTAGLVLVLLQGLTVTAVTRPHDLPRPARIDAATAALTGGLLP